jgi:methionyl-tRNA synthetase
LPVSAGKVWQQLGLGDLQDAAKNAFLNELAWGGLKAGTKFGEPAPLFPRAEKDAVERMQNLENENSKSAVEAAAGQAEDAQAPSSTSVSPTSTTGNAPQAEGDALTGTTSVPHDGSQPVDTAKVHGVPADVESARLRTTPSEAPSGSPLASEEKKPDPPAAPQQTDPATATGQAEHITIDDFAKVELRVAQVLVAERIPKADKLLRLEVDLGYEKRQILAGIAQFYEPEKLIGRKIVIVANLAPRKMRGLESNGMLLAASLPDGAPVLAGFLEEVPLGARLK